MDKQSIRPIEIREDKSTSAEVLANPPTFPVLKSGRDAVTLFEITEAMIIYGGSFAQALGHLVRLADPVNQQRLLEAFPELFTEYEELARRRCLIS